MAYEFRKACLRNGKTQWYFIPHDISDIIIHTSIYVLREAQAAIKEHEYTGIFNKDFPEGFWPHPCTPMGQLVDVIRAIPINKQKPFNMIISSILKQTITDRLEYISKDKYILWLSSDTSYVLTEQDDPYPFNVIDVVFLDKLRFPDDNKPHLSTIKIIKNEDQNRKGYKCFLNSGLDNEFEIKNNDDNDGLYRNSLKAFYGAYNYIRRLK